MSQAHDEWGESFGGPRQARAVGAGENEGRLIGSAQWQAHKDAVAAARFRRRSEHGEVLAMYTHLPEMEVDRVNSSGETETGKQLSATMVNFLELTTALSALTATERRCLILYTMENMTYREIAEGLRTSEEAVRKAVSRAVQECRERIYDRVAMPALTGAA